MLLVMNHISAVYKCLSNIYSDIFFRIYEHPDPFWSYLFPIDRHASNNII